jgi:hypothetical protein
MAYSPMTHDVINNPFGYDLTPMKPILLKDATLEEIERHYKDSPNIRQKFDDIRPSFYMTRGTFKTDPLLEHYKIFLQEKGIIYIAIKDS